MQNFLQPGKVAEFTAPVGGVVSGNAYLIGTTLVVAAHDADATEKFSGYTEGVFELPKEETTPAFVEGELIFWDDTEKEFNDSASGFYGCATAVEAAGATDETVKCKLHGFAVVVVP